VKKNIQNLILIIFTALTLVGCVKWAIYLAPSLIPNLSSVFFEECDPELARESLPADLKLLEGLLKNDPNNKTILNSLSMGFTGYAILFVEEKNPERASRLYLRAKAYGLRAMGKKWEKLLDTALTKQTIKTNLAAVGPKNLEGFFWAAFAWSAWINLNLDKAEALSQTGIIEACLEKILEIQPDYYHGLAYVLLASMLAAKPGMMGGHARQARIFFDKAMEINRNKFLLVHYYYARYYAVRIQDNKLFFRLLDEINSTPAEALKDLCLINAVIKIKAGNLRQKADELFF